MLETTRDWNTQLENACIKKILATFSTFQCITFAAACVTHSTKKITEDIRTRPREPSTIVQLVPWAMLQQDFWRLYVREPDESRLSWVAPRTIQVFETVYAKPDDALSWQVAEMIAWATLTSLTIGDARTGDPVDAAYDSLYRAYKAIFMHFAAHPDTNGRVAMNEAERQCAECLDEVKWQVECLNRVESGEFSANDML